MPQTLTKPDSAVVAEARALIKDLFNPKAWVYWTDFLFTMALGYSAFYLAHRAGYRWPLRIAAFTLSGLCFYRGVLFTHELIHLGTGTFRYFRIAWNLLCGIPLLAPSFLYYTHLEHHRPRHYATKQDGEYLPLARGPARALVLFIANSLWIPMLTILRFGLLTPLSWASRRLRELIHRHASALVIDPSYARPPPTPAERRVWRLQEILCLAWLATMATLLAMRIIPLSWLFQAYALAVFVVTINAVRTLAAHRYRIDSTEPHTLVEQLLDSIDHPRNPWLTAIWAPVGLRFHALHHFFPGLPYHALPEAHRRLMAGLPADSPYRQAQSPGLGASLLQLLRDTRTAAQQGVGAQPADSADADTAPDAP